MIPSLGIGFACEPANTPLAQYFGESDPAHFELGTVGKLRPQCQTVLNVLEGTRAALTVNDVATRAELNVSSVFSALRELSELGLAVCLQPRQGPHPGRYCFWQYETYLRAPKSSAIRKVLGVAA